LTPISDESANNSVSDAKDPLGTAASSHTAPADLQHLALIIRRDGDQLLVIEPGQTAPFVTSIKEFAERYTGQMLMARKQEETVKDIDSAKPKEPLVFAGLFLSCSNTNVFGPKCY
jgi:hypothetical protein